MAEVGNNEEGGALGRQRFIRYQQLQGEERQRERAAIVSDTLPLLRSLARKKAARFGRLHDPNFIDVLFSQACLLLVRRQLIDRYNPHHESGASFSHFVEESLNGNLLKTALRELGIDKGKRIRQLADEGDEDIELDEAEEADRSRVRPEKHLFTTLQSSAVASPRRHAELLELHDMVLGILTARLASTVGPAEELWYRVIHREATNLEMHVFREAVASELDARRKGCGPSGQRERPASDGAERPVFLPKSWFDQSRDPLSDTEELPLTEIASWLSSCLEVSADEVQICLLRVVSRSGSAWDKWMVRSAVRRSQERNR